MDIYIYAIYMCISNYISICKVPALSLTASYVQR